MALPQYQSQVEWQTIADRFDYSSHFANPEVFDEMRREKIGYWPLQHEAQVNEQSDHDVQQFFNTEDNDHGLMHEMENKNLLMYTKLLVPSSSFTSRMLLLRLTFRYCLHCCH